MCLSQQHLSTKRLHQAGQRMGLTPLSSNCGQSLTEHAIHLYTMVTQRLGNLSRIAYLSNKSQQ